MKGLSIEVLTKYMHLFLEGDSTLKEREELLIAERDRLQERLEQMQSTLERLHIEGTRGAFNCRARPFAGTP